MGESEDEVFPYLQKKQTDSRIEVGIILQYIQVRFICARFLGTIINIYRCPFTM